MFGDYYASQLDAARTKHNKRIQDVMRRKQRKVKGPEVEPSGCRGSVAEHWQPKSEVSWVQLNPLLCLVLAASNHRTKNA